MKEIVVLTCPAIWVVKVAGGNRLAIDQNPMCN